MTFRIEITSGELIEELYRELAARGVKDAALTLVGGVDGFTISNMPAGDARGDIETVYEQPGELMGTGEWLPGEDRLHLHVTCGIEGDVARAGHLHAAQVGTWFVNVYVTEAEAPRPRTGKWAA